MKTPLTRYFTDLMQLFNTMEISDRAGTKLGLDDGAAAGVDLIRSMKDLGGKAIVVGNGGSAAIASHTQNDLCKAIGVRAVVFTEPPLLTALSNDESYESAYESLVKLWAANGDLLIAISSSGRSQNILRSVNAAREAGCAIITLSGFAPDNPLRTLGDVNFHVPSHDYGPVEIVHAALCQFLTDALKVH